MNRFGYSLCPCAIKRVVIDLGVQTSFWIWTKIENMEGEREIVRCGRIHSYSAL